MACLTVKRFQRLHMQECKISNALRLDLDGYKRRNIKLSKKIDELKSTIKRIDSKKLDTPTYLRNKEKTK